MTVDRVAAPRVEVSLHPRFWDTTGIESIAGLKRRLGEGERRARGMCRMLAAKPAEHR